MTSADIRHWHCDPVETGGRGGKQVGYTDIIHLNGGVERLVGNNEDAWVDPWEVTNGAAGYNQVSRHIVYVGGKSKDGKTNKDTRTQAQKDALAKYVRNFRRKHPNVAIVGHRDLPGVKKACPCFDVKKWLQEMHL